MPETTTRLVDLTADELRDLLTERGSYAAIAARFGLSPSTVRDTYKRRGISIGSAPSKACPIPRVTKDMLDAALLPPNTCQVATLLDAIREAGRSDTLETVEMMLALPHRELPADRFRETLRGWGFPEELVPDKNHVATHRNSTLPCRCASYAALRERA